MKKGTLKLIGFAAVTLVLLVGVATTAGAVYALSNHQKAAVQVEVAEPEPGLLVAGVIPDSPADQAGLKRGDILLEINGDAINRLGELIRQLQSLAAGDEVEFTLLHGDDQRTLTVTLGERNGQPYLGVVPCGPEVGQVRVEAIKPGAIIVGVTADSPAAEAGLQPKDIITAVDGQGVDAEHQLTDLIEQYQPGDTVTLTVERPGQEAREVKVELGENPEQAGVPYLGLRFRPMPHVIVQGQALPPGQVKPIVPGLEGDIFVFPEDGEFEQAIVVRQVAPDSPADTAGLTSDDLITAIDGEPVQSPRSLVQAVAERQPDDTLELTVIQPGQENPRKLIVTLDENPDKASSAYLGVVIGGLSTIHHSDVGVDIIEEFAPFFRPGFSPAIPSFEFKAIPFAAPPFEVHPFPCDDAGNCDNSI
jgi:S1-C subfamily serine protease